MSYSSDRLDIETHFLVRQGMSTHQNEVELGRRFEFGKNWSNFLQVVNSDRINLAKQSLQDQLASVTLDGKTFLDIGSGSGLFSLAAHQLGASVHSFDYDPASVASTSELKRRFQGASRPWIVEEGSVLNSDYLAKLGQFDVVYSWGVLHHTGDMWKALMNIVPLVRHQGKVFVALYNDKGTESRLWRHIKKIYNASPVPVKFIMAVLCLAYFQGRSAVGKLLQLKSPFANRVAGLLPRGMNVWHDTVDWIGGYPYEVAKPEEIFEFFRKRGFEMVRLTTCIGGLGCNEYVFVKK
jgi:2-polyprenyl-3-methyl-5-hydroxy-6-metoxy-1,4-benzoquinol methylase